jgi:antitoxin component of RelBE/YafQ-DinJ toxin-antitoxin module
MSGEINESIEDGKKVYYGFQGLPNFWADDQDNFKGDKYFEDKDYEDYYFDNFYDMDVQFGNENSLFGTRGLPVGHPDRSSKSFNRYNEKYGPIIVRVVKEREGINESVIKENKVENLIKQYLSEFGLTKTSEMMGISLSEVVEIAKIPIDSEIANQILHEMMNNDELKTKYKDFEIHLSSNGVFYWEAMVKTGHFHDDMIENITVAATPFWDGVKYTPVEIEWYTLLNYYGVTVYETSGEGSFYKELKHQTNFESVDELLNWYEEFYLPEVYNMVMNTLVPKMHKLVDYEIKQRG